MPPARQQKFEHLHRIALLRARLKLRKSTNDDGGRGPPARPAPRGLTGSRASPNSKQPGCTLAQAIAHAHSPPPPPKGMLVVG